MTDVEIRNKAFRELNMTRYLLDSTHTIHDIHNVYKRYCSYTWAYYSIDIIDIDEVCKLQQDFAGECFKRADKLGIGRQYVELIKSL